MLPLVAFYVSALVLGGEDIESAEQSPKLARAAGDCVLPFSQSPANLPLLTDKKGTIYPMENGGSDEIIISNGKCFTAGCTPASNYLQTYSVPSLDICCTSSGLVISPQLKPTSWSQLGCAQPNKEDIVEIGTCYGGYSNVSIELKNTIQRSQPVTLCHDPASMNTIFSQHTIRGSSITAAEIYNSRPSFKKAQFYGSVSVATAYTQSSQKSMVASLVRSTSLADKYIDSTQSFYFARGHLSPDGDFVYVFEQNATYYYTNVVPQWQVINNGNWKALEAAVRKLASTLGDLQVYTGGYKVLQLKDVDNNPVDIYLARDKSTNALVIPAPRLTWKVIHDPATKRAVAIVMVNNPHILGVTSDDIVCKSICDQLSWITWDIYDTRKGYTYCCDANSFLASVPYAPNLGYTTILN